ncbi:hypothetical protein RFI_29635 [Reticulomyxa filosa]|uniref:Uncharacterized protein n=1 Tax=Reticulomyxa filosa TaxID=46433 RepID=X6M401_RETFI|nr:hypothetical protein RFI_29635 [Reticulomyxa filosa]|eukprot:ETO07755.1 hypothetical protein RFI_29635 [Reticulomyxa filosa]
MVTVSNILISTLVEQKIKRVISWEENIIEKNSVYKLSDEIPAFPISVLIVPFLLQQFIWIFSGALSDNHSHLIKSIFGSTFAIINICFIVAVIVAQQNKQNMFVFKEKFENEVNFYNLKINVKKYIILLNQFKIFFGRTIVLKKKI